MNKKILVAVVGVLIAGSGITAGVLFWPKSETKITARPIVPAGYELVTSGSFLPEEPNLQNITKRAVAVVRGTVIAIDAAQKDKVGAHSVATIMPIEYLVNRRNNSVSDAISVVIAGGTVDKTIYWSPDQVELKVSEEVILFLDYSEDTKLYNVIFDKWGKRSVVAGKLVGDNIEVDKGIDTFDKLKANLKIIK